MAREGVAGRFTTPQIRVNVYDVLVRAVEEGVAYGYGRAYKHSENPMPDSPARDFVQQTITDAVLTSINEVFQVGEDG